MREAKGVEEVIKEVSCRKKKSICRMGCVAFSGIHVTEILCSFHHVVLVVCVCEYLKCVSIIYNKGLQ